MTATAPDEVPSSADHAYFLAIERTFLGLRKQAALLTAADWQEAQSWHRQGIPVELIQDVMEKLFERQHARKGRTISGLRYFRAAVEAAWEEVLALKAGGRAEEAVALPVEARLANLAARLPPALPRRPSWVAAIAALAVQGGPPNEIEEALRALDSELLRTLREELALGDGAALVDQAAQVDRALARLRDRLAEDDLVLARARVTEQLLRRRFAAPVLSLFSPEARGQGDMPDAAPDSAPDSGD